MLTYGGLGARRALSELCWAAAALSAARSLPGAFLSAKGLSEALSSGSESNLSVLLWKRVWHLTLHHIYKCAACFLDGTSLAWLPSSPFTCLISFSLHSNTTDTAVVWCRYYSHPIWQMRRYLVHNHSLTWMVQLEFELSHSDFRTIA
jgi:hypothetical protein